jgi:hypothetical protein
MKLLLFSTLIPSEKLCSKVGQGIFLFLFFFVCAAGEVVAPPYLLSLLPESKAPQLQLPFRVSGQLVCRHKRSRSHQFLI